MKRGETGDRFDPQFLELRRLKEVRYANPKYPLTPIGEIAEYVQYGISERANTSGAGVPMIRMNNLQPLGWDLSDLKHIELDNNVLARYRLEDGDILFNRTNSKELVGKCEVFHEAGDWVFASYLIRVRLNTARALPDFVSAFLNTDAGRMQINQVSRQIAGMSNVNAEELKLLEVPLPSLTEQHLLADALSAKISKRDELLQQRRDLLNSIDGRVATELGITLVPRKDLPSFGTRLGAVRQRTDPFFHSPHFTSLDRAISLGNHAQLGELVEFSQEAWNPKKSASETFDYIEISGVDRFSGIATANRLPVVDAPSRARMITKPGDILVSLTRPHHGSIAFLDDNHEGCIASTGFAVIRDVDTDRTSARFVWTMLRMGICLDQMRRRSSGGNYPAITQEELGKVLIPLPDMAKQKHICDEVERRHIEARRLEEEAQAIWREARQHFEDQLLNGVTQ